jgi:hypothetical protein
MILSAHFGRKGEHDMGRPFGSDRISRDAMTSGGINPDGAVGLTRETPRRVEAWYEKLREARQALTLASENVRILKPLPHLGTERRPLGLT